MRRRAPTVARLAATSRRSVWAAHFISGHFACVQVTSESARACTRSLCFEFAMPRPGASTGENPGENPDGSGSTGCGNGDESQTAAAATLPASQSSTGHCRLDGWLPSPCSDLPDALLTENASEATRLASGPSVPDEGTCHECRASASSAPLTYLPGCPEDHAFFCVECVTHGTAIASSSSAALSLLWCPVCRVQAAEQAARQ